MKNNRSYGFAKKNLISILFMLFFIVIGLFSSFSFLSLGIDNFTDSKEILNIYQETTFDYIVTGLDEKNYSYVENISSINQYAEFYNVVGVTNTNKGEADIYVRSLKDNSKLYLTEYTDSRVIHKIEDTNNSIYIFESFSNSYDVKIGNIMKIAGIEFTVSRIYKDSFDNSNVYIPNFSNKIYQKFSQTLSISGMYVTCNNKEDFHSKIDKISNIYFQDKMEKYDEKKTESENFKASSKTNFLFFALLFGSICLIGEIIYLIIFKKKIKKEIVDNGKKELNLRNLYTNIVCLFTSIIMILLITYSLVENKNNFIGVLKFNYLSLLIVFGFIFISFFLNMLFVNVHFSNTLKSKNIKK